MFFKDLKLLSLFFQLGPHVLGESPLRRLPCFDLIYCVPLDAMHLGDGGVLQTHGEYLLYAAGACNHDSRLAKLNKHKLSTTEFENLNVVLKVYASIKIDEFPRTFRYVHDRFCE